MSLARTIIIFTLTVSFFTFVAFFGRLPAFKNTPIGILHRLLTQHIPSSLRTLDLKLTNGRITNGGSRLAHHLMYEKHWAIVTFFLGLLSGSIFLFLPVIWPLVRPRHKLLAFALIPQPYIFLYLSAKRNAQAYITPANHASQMRYYPYDRVLYHPGMSCTTCRFLKPARSKHCSICRHCVARADHHCVWVNNCLGRGNYKYFLALLFSTGVLLAYGAYLAYYTLSPLARAHFKMYERWFTYVPPASADPNGWTTRAEVKFHNTLNYAGIYLEVGGLRAAGVGLLALLTWPLPLGLLVYHVYLIWAGMTTNESGKWADWREDMADGVVYLGTRREETMRVDYGVHHITLREEQDQVDEPPTTWPLESRHILIRTRDSLPPRILPARIASVASPNSFERVWNLAAVENVYDLGFWDNFREVLWD